MVSIILACICLHSGSAFPFNTAGGRPRARGQFCGKKSDSLASVLVGAGGRRVSSGGKYQLDNRSTVFAILTQRGNRENGQKASVKMDQTGPKGKSEIRSIKRQLRNQPSRFD